MEITSFVFLSIQEMQEVVRAIIHYIPNQEA